MEEEQKQDYREHLINTIDMLIDSGISVYDLDVVNKKAIRYNYVPKQKVKDKINELKERIKKLKAHKKDKRSVNYINAEYLLDRIEKSLLEEK